MLLGILTGPNSSDVERQIEKGSAFVDGFEWRLDLFSLEALAELSLLLKKSGLPHLFTLRSSQQGGGWQGSEEERKNTIQELLVLEPDYADLETDCSYEWVQKIVLRFPKTRFILSHHNFKETPLLLEEQWMEMLKLPAYGYKLATQTHSTLDALRLLFLVKKQTALGYRIAGIPMGSFGKAVRPMGPVVGNLFDYGIIEEHPSVLSAGVPSVVELHTRYHYHQLSSSSSLYALLGDPVDLSLSHRTHNAEFRKREVDALYLKLRITQEELPAFFHLVSEFSFKGFSVTMPLKEVALSRAEIKEEGIEEVGALNTLSLLDNGKWRASNTDGLAAVQLIKERRELRDKRCVIIGAGGTARAIAYEALRHGAQVVLVNRTLERAEAFTNQYGGVAQPLSALDEIAEQGYDILIHATSVGFAGQEGEEIIEERHLLPSALLLEVVARPRQTPLVIKAEKKGCQIIYGEALFLRQAALQFQLWLSSSSSRVGSL